MKRHSLILIFLVSIANGHLLAADAVTATQFEEWAKASRTKAELAKSSPDFTATVLERLKEDKFVTDDTILTAVTALSYYEQQQAAAQAGVNAEYKFDRTLSFIAQVEPNIEGRTNLEARLLLKKAYCLTTARQREKAIAAQRKAAVLLEQLHLQIDAERNGNLNELAESLLAGNQKNEADYLFLEVMSYPWYNVTQNPEAFRQLRDEYFRAARGLISCRRHNLEALKQIALVPATQEELKPALDEAIAEASH